VRSSLDEIASEFSAQQCTSLSEDLQPLLVCQAVIGTVDQMVEHRTSTTPVKVKHYLVSEIETIRMSAADM
jgi:hypothetical protein